MFAKARYVKEAITQAAANSLHPLLSPCDLQAHYVSILSHVGSAGEGEEGVDISKARKKRLTSEKKLAISDFIWAQEGTVAEEKEVGCALSLTAHVGTQRHTHAHQIKETHAWCWLPILACHY